MNCWLKTTSTTWAPVHISRAFPLWQTHTLPRPHSLQCGRHCVCMCMCVYACLVAAQPCVCSFAVCVTGHQSWLDTCIVASESVHCQVALRHRKTQSDSDGERRVCVFKWMNELMCIAGGLYWLLWLIVWQLAASSAWLEWNATQLYWTEATHHHMFNTPPSVPSINSIFKSL